MRKILLIISAFFIVFAICLLAIGQFTGTIDIRTTREGDIIQTSLDANELMRISNRLKFLDGNIKSCKWYRQVSDTSGRFFLKTYDYCYNGDMVLKDDYYNIIIAEYNWDKYDYAKHLRNLGEDDFVLNPMYNISMIRDSLKSKQLYVCDNLVFSDSNTFYTFLDKESKTLYFYCWSF